MSLEHSHFRRVQNNHPDRGFSPGNGHSSALGAVPGRRERARRRIARTALVSVGALALVLLGLHFLHPLADFPNYSPWMDYAKYTDEGWYGSAAVSWFTRGNWYVPGDFNPGVALPVWPFVEWLLFHATGVSLGAARELAVAIFAGNLVLAHVLLRRYASPWIAMLAVLLLASNAFLYCFSRLAILEPPMIFLMLLSWLLALGLPAAQGSRRYALAGVLGLLLCAMVLTKTTAIFLFPGVFYLLWWGLRRDRRALIVLTGAVALGAAVPWLAYYLFAVRPQYLADYRYLFSANVYPQPQTAEGWLMAFWYAAHGALWIDARLAALAAVLLVLSLAWLRELWLNPVFVASCLACGGYLFFIGFHNNMQPRYYQVVAFPLLIASMLATQALFRKHQLPASLAGWAALLTVAVSLGINIRETVWFAFHPEYTFVDAARSLTRYIDLHPYRNRLLLSISAGNIALVTGLPAICDDFGTLELPDRIRKYQPGWYAAWNELDPGTLEDLHTQFRLEQVANFPAYDDEDRNNLILYKLVPIDIPTESPRKPRPRKAPGVKPATQSHAL